MAFVRTHVKGYGRKQMHARVRTHTQSTLGNSPLGGFWITMFSMLSAAWHH